MEFVEKQHIVEAYTFEEVMELAKASESSGDQSRPFSFTLFKTKFVYSERDRHYVFEHGIFNQFSMLVVHSGEASRCVDKLIFCEKYTRVTTHK